MQMSESETNKRIEIGNVVTRDGTDRHVVVAIDYDWGTLVVECITAPKTKWIKKGERESNLISRYKLVS